MRLPYPYKDGLFSSEETGEKEEEFSRCWQKRTWLSILEIEANQKTQPGD